MSTYTMHYLTGLFGHTATVPKVVQDGIDGENIEFQARVQSGDYFVTLATEIDKVVNLLRQADMLEAEVLETHVNELLYIDKHYKIIKK